MDDFRHLGRIFRREVFGVPFDLLARLVGLGSRPNRQVAQQHRFCERHGVIGEIRHRWLAPFDGGDPFVPVAGRFGELRFEFFQAVGELDFAFGVVARSIEHAFFADHEAGAVGETRTASGFLFVRLFGVSIVGDVVRFLRALFAGLRVIGLGREIREQFHRLDTTVGPEQF